MSFKNHLIVVLVLVMLSPLAGGDVAEKPAPISPGNGSEIGLVTGLTPTFSWAAVSWANHYRVALFPGRDAGNLGYHDMAALANPVLFKEIPGGATSWTPSYGEKLEAGSLYVWFVQALDESGAGEWSACGRFVVLSQESLNLAEVKLKETLWTAGVSPEEADSLVKDVKSGLTADVPAGDSPTDTSKPLGSEGDARYNTYYGTGAGSALTTSAGSNSFFGYASGISTNSGNANTFVGSGSGFKNQEGASNTCIGKEAGYNTNASNNAFVGYRSGLQNITGTNNAYFGNESGSFANGSNNVFLGYFAGGYETGSNKLYIENSDSSSPLIYGEFDNDVVAINGKLGIGNESPEFTLHAQTTGENCMLVLDRTDGASFKLATVTNKVQIGCQSNHDVRFTSNNIARMVITKDGNVGINELNPAHRLQLGGGAYCDGGAWVAGSSRSLKTDIQSLDGSEAEAAVMNLQPVKFRYKANTAEEYLGFIAEDVPDLVAMNGRKGMTAMDVVAALTKVVQKQQDTIRDQEKTLQDLQRLVLEQAKAIQVQQEDLRELKAKVEKSGSH